MKPSDGPDRQVLADAIKDSLVEYRAVPKKKRCENCFALFERKKHAPSTKRFCSDRCRKEFHHHGSAFGPLRVRLEKMIAQGVKELKVRLDGIEARVKRLESR